MLRLHAEIDSWPVDPGDSPDRPEWEGKLMTVLWTVCPVGEKCPQVHDYTAEEVIVQGYTLELRDPAKAAKLAAPPNEGLVIVPKRQWRPEYLRDDELVPWIRERFTRSLLRVENRRAYEVESDGGDFARFLHGADAPLEGEEWMAQLRSERAAGKRRSKVHITHDGHLSDYEMYACRWGFARTVQAGEAVRMVDNDGAMADVPDFSVIDGKHVLRMDYDEHDQWIGAMPISGPDAAVYRALAAQLWQGGAEFTPWWAVHPQARQRPRAA